MFLILTNWIIVNWNDGDFRKALYQTLTFSFIKSNLFYIYANIVYSNKTTQWIKTEHYYIISFIVNLFPSGNHYAIPLFCNKPSVKELTWLR